MRIARKQSGHQNFERFPDPERFSLEGQEWTTKKGFDQDNEEWFEDRSVKITDAFQTK